MKSKRFIRLTLSLLLIIVVLCSFNVAVFASGENSKLVYWESGDVVYSATVYRTNQYNTREIPIMSSAVRLLKNGSYDFGECTYRVTYTNTLWTQFVEKLDAAGALANVASTYNENIYFRNKVTAVATDAAGTFCAFTECYGYVGGYYVERHGAGRTTIYEGEFSFAPYNCHNMILYALDTRYI